MGNALATAGTALKALLLRAASVVETCGTRNRLSQGLLPRFSRITSGGTFMPEIDGLRFIAIFWVFGLHLVSTSTLGAEHSTVDGLLHHSGFLGFLYQRGRIGVPLFFIISGFILGMPFAKQYLCGSKAVSLPKYFLRRVTRLEPPYMIQLAIATTIIMISIILSQHRHELSGETTAAQLWITAKHLLASLCYQHTMIFDNFNPINDVLWSLEVEIQFYCLVPLLALIFTIRSATLRRLVLVSIIIAFTCFSLTDLAQHNNRIYLSILSRLQWFMTGFLLVDIMVATPAEQLKPKLRWDLVALAGWCALPLCEAHTETYGFTVLAAFLAYLGVFRGQVVGAFFRNPWISTIGGMCYTIYMYHAIILAHCTRYIVPILHVQNVQLNLLIQTVLLGGVVLVPCAVMFMLCERPFMQRDWPQKAWAAGRRLFLAATGRRLAGTEK